MLIITSKSRGNRTRPGPPYILEKDNIQAQGLAHWWPDITVDDFIGTWNPVLNAGSYKVGGHDIAGLGYVGDGTVRYTNAGNVPFTPTDLTNVLSLTVWALSNDITNQQSIWALGVCGGAGTNRYSIDFRGATAGDFAGCIAQSGAATGTSLTTKSYADGNIHHVVGAFQPSQRTAWIDGGNSATQVTVVTGNTPNQVTLLANNINNVPSQMFNGTIAIDFRAYNYYLTDDIVYRMWHPYTRWEAYWIPGRKAFFNVSAPSAVTTVQNILHY